jgi:hypothetical protein
MDKIYILGRPDPQLAVASFVAGGDPVSPHFTTIAVQATRFPAIETAQLCRETMRASRSNADEYLIYELLPDGRSQIVAE